MTKFFLTIITLLTISTSLLARDAQGGGFLNSGILGKWYNNSSFAGEAVFERKDVRIMFDWGKYGLPGGARYNNFEKLKSDNFSVKWQGTIVARFSEEYTFIMSADDGAVVKIRPQGTTQWQTIIDKLNQAGVHQGSIVLNKDQKYDIAIDYVEKTGEAKAILEWQGNSFPKEVIDTVLEVSLNVPTYVNEIWADGIAAGRNNWNRTNIDANGDPTGDGEFIFWEILSPYVLSPRVTGIMELSFEGKADISTRGMCMVMPNSVKYDPTTNISTATIKGIDNGRNVSAIIISNSTRTGEANGPAGVKNMKLMLPNMDDPTQAMSSNFFFHPKAINAFNRFTGLRFQRINDQSEVWEDRTPPWWPYKRSGKSKPYVYNQRYAKGHWNLKGNSGIPHEYEIMLCNVTGNDYYISTPHLADDNYFKNLALLIKYGSNEKGEPYTQNVENPYYPPLNPNLRVYVELSNELWNWGSISIYSAFFDLQQKALDLYDNGSLDGKLLNYDNLLEKGGKKKDGSWEKLGSLGRRYWTYKTAQISNCFREIFGDEEMPLTSKSPRIRPLFGWQYNNSGGTASEPLDFMEKVLYDSKYVQNPQPPNYYFYAGGGAGYYGASNKFGLIENSPKNGSFEEDDLSMFTLANGAKITTQGQENMPIPQAVVAPQTNKKALCLNGLNSSMSFKFTAPKDQKSPYYGVLYRAVLPEKAKSTNQQILSLLVDGKEMAILTGRGTQPLPWTQRAMWNRVAWHVGSWYFSENIILNPGQSCEITFKSLTSDTPIFIDLVHMSSLDAFYSSQIPSGGSATGQGVVGKRGHEETIMGDGRWAATYGLNYMTYEHGWSAGGDAGDTPLQVQAKYYDSRAANAQQKALEIFEQAGGVNATFGTYATWPVFSEPNRVFGTATIDSWPLMQGLNRVTNALPVAITNGTPIPGAVYGERWSAVDNVWNTKYDNLQPTQWASYNFVATTTNKYKIAVALSGDGEATISINGVSPVVKKGKATGVLTATVPFVFGVNAVRITALSGKVMVNKVTCVPLDYTEEKITEVSALYGEVTTNIEVKNQVWLEQNFDKAKVGALHNYKENSDFLPWVVQNKDTTLPGFEIKDSNPLSQGCYISGGTKHLHGGVLPNFDKVPDGYKKVDGKETYFGVIGSSIYTSFKARANVVSDEFKVIWSNRTIPHMMFAHQLGVVIHNNVWALAIKNRQNKFTYANSKIPVVAGKIYNIILAVHFTPKETKAELYIDGQKEAEITSDAALKLTMLVFFPSSKPDGGDLDDIKIGDSLNAVK